MRQAQVEADRRREACLAQGRSFSFETVMSHRSKIEVLQKAKSLNFDIILYFVATSSAAINVNRVMIRVYQGGHDVPFDRIVDRYARTLALLPDALKLADDAYIFDNSILWNGGSDSGLRLVCRLSKTPPENSLAMTILSALPLWFEAALDALAADGLPVRHVSRD